MNWYADISLGTIDDAAEEEGKKADFIMRSDLDSRCDENKIIPVIVLTVTFNDGAHQQLSRGYKLQSLLPKAMDTKKRTKAWVKRLLVQLGICPVTKLDIRSGQGLKNQGVPVANIMYRHSKALGEGSDIYLLMASEYDVHAQGLPIFVVPTMIIHSFTFSFDGCRCVEGHLGHGRRWTCWRQ
jgi:hypothetical protein